LKNVSLVENLNVDVSLLQKKLIDNPQFFNDYANRVEKLDSPHRESSDIWVRYGDYDKYGEEVFSCEHDSIWFPILKEIKEVLPIVFKIMNRVHGERLGGVLITKIEKGKKIYPHIDTVGWHPAYYDKFYVPILNKEGSIFGFEGDGDIQAKEGEVYWFRNDVSHWVNNDSDSDRIAMVVCVKPFREDLSNGK